MTRVPVQLSWAETSVDGRRGHYGVAGDGPPLVFLHGWGLGYRSYRAALRELVAAGLTVYAPAMPGFAGTPDLADDVFSMEGYAAWVAEFAQAVGVGGPFTLVGHSFGGGVAIRTAHDFPGMVDRLVVVNSIGGSAWAHSGSALRSMAERPLWDWGLHFQADLMPVRQLTRVLPVILGDAVPNLLRNPRSLWRVGGLARRADLTAELEELRRRRLPVVVVWGEGDKVLPRLAMESMRTALGAECITVAGNHSWLIADPAAFGEIMTNVVSLAATAKRSA